jgi:hypothetical protein
VRAAARQDAARVTPVLESAKAMPIFDVSEDGRWLYYQQEHTNVLRVPWPAQDWRSAPPEQVTHSPVRENYVEEPPISCDGRTLVYAHARIAGDIWLLGPR